jgi:hypothetical protein
MKRLHQRPRGVDKSDRSPDGVDRSLIRWTLSLSPRQRLQVLDEHLRTIRALRRDVAGR